MRRGLCFGIVVAVNMLAFVACDEIEREPPNRYFVPVPDQGDGGIVSLVDATADDRKVDANADSASDAQVLEVPATLPLTGWWRASYQGSPWVGLPSLGPSKGRELSEPTNAPVAGTPLNGVTPAAFDGMGDKLTSPTPISDFLAATAWEVHALFSADSARPHSPGTPYTAPALISDSINGWFYLAFSTAGVMAGHYDGVSFKEIFSPCPTGGIHAVQAWFDGTSLNLIVDGAQPAIPVPAGAAMLGTGLLKAGANYNDAVPFDGRIFEILTSNQLLGPGGRAAVRIYFNFRYGTTFPK